MEATHDDTLALQMRQVVELPLKLHHYIIAFLKNGSDAGTIAKCALVCRRWLPFSQSKLYDDVWLNYRRQWISFECLMLKPPSSIVEYLGGVQRLLIQPLDDKFIDKEEKQPRIGWGEGQERPWAHLVLIQCAAQLVDQLTQIRLYEIDWTCAQDSAVLCGRNYLSLSKLELFNCTFVDIGQLGLLVTGLPGLDVLSLRSIKLQSLKPLKPLQLSSIPKAGHSLTGLELGCLQDVMAALTPWLAHTQLVRNLACLHWWWEHSEDDWRAISEAIDGPCLQELYLYDHRDWKGSDRLLAGLSFTADGRSHSGLGSLYVSQNPRIAEHLDNSPGVGPAHPIPFQHLFQSTRGAAHSEQLLHSRVILP